MQYKWLGSLLGCLVTLGAWVSTAPAQEIDDDDMAVSLRYFGETITHGGVSVGAEAYLMDGANYKMILAPNIGWYVHPRNHHGAFIDLEYGGRLTADFGLFGDAFVGLGYFHRFPDGEIFSVEDGTVESQSNAGDPNVMGSGWLGFGWDLEKNDVAPVNLHVRLGAFGEWPYTGSGVVLPHTVLQAGATYKF